MKEEKFLFQVSDEQLQKIEKILEEKKIPYLLCIWDGIFRVNGDNPKYLGYYGNCETKGCEWWVYCNHGVSSIKNYFGTMDHFTFSDDDCFGHLDIDEKKIKPPNVSDVFKFKEW